MCCKYQYHLKSQHFTTKDLAKHNVEERCVIVETPVKALFRLFVALKVKIRH